MRNSADRKKKLIAQGALYRVEVLHATQMTRASLRPDALARGAFHQLQGVALSMFSKKTGIGLGAGAQALLPLLLSAAPALLRKKSLWKPALRGTLVAAAIAAATVFLSKEKTPPAHSDADA
jgi:uncharacterized membrane protein